MGKKLITCDTCGGAGIVRRRQYNHSEKRTEEIVDTCPTCGGDRKIWVEDYANEDEKTYR